MHDNAQPHSYCSGLVLLEQGGIAVLLWPAQSPDMNPIEHAWDMLQRSVTPDMRHLNTEAVFKTNLQQNWQNLP